MATEEKIIENAIVKHLRLKGYVAWSNENTATFNPKRKTFRSFNAKTKYKGTPDIFALKALFYAIEVKTPKKYAWICNNLDKWLRERISGKLHNKNILTVLGQYDFMQMINSSGGYGFFTDSVKDTIDKINIYSAKNVI